VSERERLRETYIHTYTQTWRRSEREKIERKRGPNMHTNRQTLRQKEGAS
jgi:hypothetical protein